MIRIATLLFLLTTACTVPSAEELYTECDQPLRPEDVGVLPDVVIGDTRACSALRLDISYILGQGCVKLTVTDLDDPGKMERAEVSTGLQPSGSFIIAVMARAGWSPNRRLTAAAHERSCNGVRVAEESVETYMMADLIRAYSLSLSAEDLDGDGYVSARGTYPGTDCNDLNPAVYPGAIERCDGIDNNCANGESDAPGC